MTQTREQIVAEPAGPRLDAWVASMLRGMPVDRTTIAYSVDIEAAWSVVLHLRSRRFTADVSLSLDMGDRDAFASFRGENPRGGRDPEGFARARTVPLAICRAALLATLPEAA